MLHDLSLYAGNPSYQAVARQQFEQLTAQRNADGASFHQLVANAGRRPQDLYQEWDPTTVRQFRLDEGDNILNRLMGLSRPLPIGRTVLAQTRSSDLGTFQQSMTGEHGTVFDKVDYDSDKAIVPVSTTGHKTNWRENQQLSLESFDDAAVKREEDMRTHRKGVIDSLLDGHKDKNGQVLSEDGVTWLGMRADPRVDQVDLGAGGLNIDFTDKTLTGVEFYDGFLALAERRYITNRITAPATFFVSNEIYWNMQRQYNANQTQGKIEAQLRTIPGVGDIVPSSKLVGNEVMSMVLSQTYFQPLVGMAVSVIAVPRLRWNDPFAFETVSAIGWHVKSDFENGNTAAQFAAG